MHPGEVKLAGVLALIRIFDFDLLSHWMFMFFSA